MAWQQVTSTNMKAEDGIGWCLRHTQTALRAPVAYESATQAWENQRGRKTGLPPMGVAVPIWLEHWGNYGTPSRYANWGHVAVWLGDGRVLTSPMNASQTHWDPNRGWIGQAIYSSIEAMIRALGNGKYLGWSTHMNGREIVKYTNNPVKPTPPTPPSTGQEDDDMATYIGMYIGGSASTPADKRSCVIFEPTSGFYTTWGGVNQEYINDMARTFGTKNFGKITRKHWDQTILPQLLIQQKKGGK